MTATELALVLALRAPARRLERVDQGLGESARLQRSRSTLLVLPLARWPASPAWPASCSRRGCSRARPGPGSRTASTATGSRSRSSARELSLVYPIVRSTPALLPLLAVPLLGETPSLARRGSASRSWSAASGSCTARGSRCARSRAPALRYAWLTLLATVGVLAQRQGGDGGARSGRPTAARSPPRARSGTACSSLASSCRLPPARAAARPARASSRACCAREGWRAALAVASQPRRLRADPAGASRRAPASYVVAVRQSSVLFAAVDRRRASSASARTAGASLGAAATVAGVALIGFGGLMARSRTDALRSASRAGSAAGSSRRFLRALGATWRDRAQRRRPARGARRAARDRRPGTAACSSRPYGWRDRGLVVAGEPVARRRSGSRPCCARLGFAESAARLELARRARALLRELIRRVRAGEPIGILPDGPRGPARRREARRRRARARDRRAARARSASPPRPRCRFGELGPRAAPPPLRARRLRLRRRRSRSPRDAVAEALEAERASSRRSCTGSTRGAKRSCAAPA